jgi:hypothetical protein
MHDTLPPPVVTRFSARVTWILLTSQVCLLCVYVLTLMEVLVLVEAETRTLKTTTT